MTADALRGRRLGDPRRPIVLWLAVGWGAFALLPWYGVDEGILDPGWLLDGWAWDDYYAPGLFQGLWHGKAWLLPLVVFLALPIVFTFLFLGMPSGLVIYWMVSNILTIGQQLITNRIIGGKVPVRAAAVTRKG